MKFFLNLGRVLLLLITVLAVCTLLVWKFKPDWVHLVDDAIVKRYLKRTNYAWNDAKEALKAKNPAEAIAILEGELAELHGVQKRDRLAEKKRILLWGLTETLETEGELQRARKWVEHWIEFDDRDLRAKVRLARLAYRIPGNQEEGVQIARELQEQFPEVASFNELYVDMLLGQDQPQKAVAALASYLQSCAVLTPKITGEDWDVFWDTGDGMSERQRKRLPVVENPNGLLSFEVELPKDTKRFRIDPPSGKCISLVKPVLILLGDGSQKEQKIWQQKVKTHNMEVRNDRLYLAGDADPYFHWRLPKAWATTQFSVKFSTGTAFSQPGWIREVLALTVSKGLEDTFAGDNYALQRLNFVRLQLLLEATMQANWVDGAAPASCEAPLQIQVSANEDEASFELDFNLQAKLSEVTLVLPELVGLTYTLSIVQLVDGAGIREIAFGLKSGLDTSSCEVIGNDVFVTGPNPQVRISLGGVKDIQRLKLRGTVK